MTDAAENRTRAVLMMLTGVAMLSMNDAAGKLLLARYDPLQIAFARGVLALGPLVALVLMVEGRRGLRSHGTGIHALRGLLLVLATMAFFGSLKTLSLAEGTSLLFTAPIMVAVIAAAFLREQVNAARWASVGLGFAGALIVIRPGMAAFEAASLLALLAALLYALIMLTARRIDARDGLWTMSLYLTGFSVVFAAPSLAMDWPVARGEDAALLAATALLGTGGAALMTQAFRLAPATLIAPLDYTALIWASVAGWALFGHVPDWPVYTGAAVIVAGGIVLLRAEASEG